jgi:mannose-6-phosphate isomerase-like protein (cupin superfamily)
MKVRRIVTLRTQAGKSIFASVDHAPRTHDFVHVPGMAITQIWSTSAQEEIPSRPLDPTAAVKSIVPLPGGTQMLVVSFPPDSESSRDDFDPKAAADETLQHAPGLAELFEADEPGMHASDTVDYAIVLEGELWLELDDGQVQHLRAHDVVVQNGTRHAWRNRGTKPAVMAVVMIGAKRGGDRAMS